MIDRKLRVVLDCMVYLQAVVNEHGPAAKVIRAVEEQRFELFVSAEVLEEVREVLHRPRLNQKFPQLTTDKVDALVEFLQNNRTFIQNVPQTFRYARDPKDEKYINLALITEAHYLVSRDSDLLDLMNERRDNGKAFRQRFPLLIILDPVVFLIRLAEAEQ